MIDWGLARRTAGAVGAGVGPIGSQPPVSTGYLPAIVRDACEDAIERAAQYAGLGAVTKPPLPELVDRREWSGGALSTLAQAAKPVEDRAEAELGLPGPLAGLIRGALGAGPGAELGAAVGYASRRVLGQYDVALFGPQRPARLLFVAENMERARLELEADPVLFVRWIALHESAHVVQFERVEWLAPHLRGLAGGLIESATASLDATSIGGLARRLLGDPRELVRALARGELARILADPEQRAVLDRLQATMSVVEGHAEHLMDAASPELGPELVELRARLERRRADRHGLSAVIGRLLGIEMKLRQYTLGKRFCDAVAGERGPEGLRAVWASAEQLPDLAELESPRLWLDRVPAASPDPA